MTGFNEWWEGAQIVPTAGTVGTTTRDRSMTGKEVTRGRRYEDHGYKCPDMLREMAADWESKE